MTRAVSSSTDVKGRPDIVRYYDEARSAHLERLDRFRASEFLYSRASYDFDTDLAREVGANQVTALMAAWRIFRAKPRVVELNEPALMKSWPKLWIVHTAVVLTNRLPGPKVRVVSYAIENGDLPRFLASRFRVSPALSRWIVKTATKPLLRNTTRLAFGTVGAKNMYETLAQKEVSSIESRVFLELMAPCASCRSKSRAPGRVVFLGAFEERKGIAQLINAWPQVADRIPGVSLQILGKGPMESVVRQWARGRTDVQLEVDPSRACIHGSLAGASVVVLMSMPHPRWREQVGLPIVEGLSHGCVVVASSETGISRWLSEHGHVVLDPNNAQSLDAAIAAALQDPRTAETVIRDLPEHDVRVDADAWLTDGDVA